MHFRAPHLSCRTYRQGFSSLILCRISTAPRYDQPRNMYFVRRKTMKTETARDIDKSGCRTLNRMKRTYHGEPYKDIQKAYLYNSDIWMNLSSSWTPARNKGYSWKKALRKEEAGHGTEGYRDKLIAWSTIDVPLWYQNKPFQDWSHQLLHGDNRRCCLQVCSEGRPNLKNRI